MITSLGLSPEARARNFDAAVRDWLGMKGAHRSGKTMDGFRAAIVEELLAIGIHMDDIFPNAWNPESTRKHRAAGTLPSHFRASKDWDLLVIKNSRFKEKELGNRAKSRRLSAPADPKLVLAVEFKSQTGSIGNNQNNRIEESLGSALDFWESYRAGVFGKADQESKPLLGYLFVGQYQPSDREPVSVSQTHFDAAPRFRERVSVGDGRCFIGPSYDRRYGIFLDGVVQRDLYQVACFIAATPNLELPPGIDAYGCPFPSYSVDAFMNKLLMETQQRYF